MLQCSFLLQSCRNVSWMALGWVDNDRIFVFRWTIPVIALLIPLRVYAMNSPRCSDSCRPLSPLTTRSSSMSHLFPTSSTWALSHEYVLIWVDLGTNTPSSQRGELKDRDHNAAQRVLKSEEFFSHIVWLVHAAKKYSVFKPNSCSQC